MKSQFDDKNKAYGLINESWDQFVNEDWWTRLSLKKQEAYVKSHPNSKKAKQAKQKDKMKGDVIPKNLNKMSRKQQQSMVDELSQLPLKQLRKRQDLIKAQQKIAHREYQNASGVEKKRFEAGSINLGIMDNILMAAVDKREFGD